jgi:anti-anti-sigma regulatory factor
MTQEEKTADPASGIHVADAINRVLVETQACDTDIEVAEVFLGIARAFTGSHLGLVGELTASGRLNMLALSAPAELMDRMPGVLASEVELCEVRQQVIAEKMPIFVNDLNAPAIVMGLPDGFPVVGTYMGVAMLHQEKVIGLISLMNKPGGFVDADAEAVARFAAAFVEVLNRKRAEDAMRINNLRLETLLQMNQMTMTSEQEITNFALEEAVRQTNSEIGYLAFMSEGESVLTMHSWSKNAMKQCAMIDKPIVYPVEQTGLWGEAVRQRKPIITNDYLAPSTAKRGYPDGHVPVRRHMNIPLFDGEQIVLVAGVGNKRAPYDDSDILRLTLLMQAMWKLLQRKRADEAIQRAHVELESRVEERTRELQQINQSLQREVAERKRAEETIRRQTDEILELSTPVLQVWQGIVLAPLIGTLDSQRTQLFMERLLQTIVDTNSPAALVDITGVPAIDTQTAQHLIDTINAVKLIGAEVILTGVRPAIAQALVHLGIDLTGITTRASMAAGLRYALQGQGLDVH